MTIDITKTKEAIEIMCEKCENHETCQGTGCSPKNRISDLIKATEHELIKKLFGEDE